MNCKSAPCCPMQACRKRWSAPRSPPSSRPPMHAHSRYSKLSIHVLSCILILAIMLSAQGALLQCQCVKHVLLYSYPPTDCAERASSVAHEVPLPCFRCICAWLHLRCWNFSCSHILIHSLLLCPAVQSVRCTSGQGFEAVDVLRWAGMQ